ncbi:MAG: Rpn family recombination-promoting nuclease/putative transposase [Treponemataceae bacterium]|nr:Rpn family recombination-promoting nuclease/putative transposase [Treponemataceae bacterium]
MTNGHKRYRTKPWEELTFADNFLFCKIMEDSPELCRQLLELLLHIKIGRLEPPQGERTMQETLGAKAVRFDVYTKDDRRIFDIEIQTTDAQNLPERARYYQSVIDMDNLSKGENYTKLKDTYVIFLCLKDIFRRGLPVYFFENTCRADRNLTLGDRAYKVFFNAANCDTLESDEMRSFFRFLKGERAKSAFSKRIAEKVVFAKRNMQWRKQYMTWQQTIDVEKMFAFEEGHDAGVLEGIRESARNLLKEGDSPEKIARCCSLPLEEVLALREELSREPVAQ